MAMRLERWLERRVDIRPGEIELSEAAAQRLYRPEEGEAVVPAGIIGPHPSGRPDEYTIREHDGPFPSAISMTEGDIDKKMTMVDARILGEPGHRYDRVFTELNDERATARYERIHRKADRYRLAGWTGVLALGAIWAATSLPAIKLVGPDNCYNATSAEDTFIKPASSVRPAIRQHAAEQGDTCDLGGRQYVLLQKGGQNKKSEQHKPGPRQHHHHQTHRHQSR